MWKARILVTIGAVALAAGHVAMIRPLGLFDGN